MQKVRIPIPTNPEKILDLAGQVASKHKVDKTNSLLKNMADYDWDQVSTQITYAKDKHREAEEYRRKMEESYKERDRHLPAITEAVKATRDMLKGTFMKNPRKLGDWGYTVNDAKVATKSAATKKED